MNAQAVAMGAITQIRALGGVIGLAIVTNVLNSYIKSQLSISLSKEQMALLLQSTAYIPTFPPELQALVKDVYARAFNLQMKVVVGFAGAQVLALPLVWGGRV